MSGYVKNMEFERGMFAENLVSYVTVDFKKVVIDLLHAGSTLVESECIKRKMRLSE